MKKTRYSRPNSPSLCYPKLIQPSYRQLVIEMKEGYQKFSIGYCSSLAPYQEGLSLAPWLRAGMRAAVRQRTDLFPLLPRTMNVDLRVSETLAGSAAPQSGTAQ